MIAFIPRLNAGAFYKSLGKFEKFPIEKEDSYFYNEYLKGVEKMGCPIENEGDYIQNLFSKYGVNSKRYEYVFEQKTKITEKLIDL